MARLLDRMNFTALINQERRRLNLAPVNDILRHVLGRHVVVASDPALAAVPPDVELDCIQTGYLHLKTDHALPGPVAAFLAVGPAPIRRSRLTTGRLAAAINECIADQRYTDRASKIAGEIEKQDSLGLAVDDIEKTFVNR